VKLNTGLGYTSSLNPSYVGQSVTLTVTIASAATGTVQFLDSGTLLATVTVASGVAAFSTSSFAQGTHAISVVYSGDANYLGFQSAPLSQVVNAKASSATAVSSSVNPSIVGQSVKFTALVTPTSATGTVQFLDGTTLLGTASVSSGSASLTTTTLAQGAHSITAAYSGDAADTRVHLFGLDSDCKRGSAYGSIESNRDRLRLGPDQPRLDRQHHQRCHLRCL